MKRTLLFFIFFTLIFQSSLAQKFAFIDTDYILNQIPEYTKAQKDLDDLAEKWQKEIEAKYNEIEKKYKALGGNINVISKPGIGHHPHALKDPRPIVDFILKHSLKIKVD